MKNHNRMLLVAMGIVLVTACDRGKAEAERKAAEADKQTQEATITAGKIQAEADQAAKLKAAHNEARMKLQKDFDAHDRKANYLKTKAARAVGASKKNADAAIRELEARRNVAKASMNRLVDDAAPDWDAMKKAAEDDISSVGKAVDALEDTLPKK